MSQHTQGPWDTGVGEDAHFVYDCEMDVIAEVHEPFGVSAAEACANARLIAAAPDLLAACSGVLSYLNGGATIYPGSDFHRELGIAAAKAEGRDP